jgi:hypothetical protein
MEVDRKVSDNLFDTLFEKNSSKLQIFNDMYTLAKNTFVHAHFLDVVYQESHIEVNNYAQFFVCNTCIKEIALSLNIFFTLHDTNKKVTGCNFLCRIFDKMSSVSTPEFVINLNNLKVIKDEILDIYKCKFKIFRNKRYAHLDSDFYNKSQNINAITKDDFEKIRDFVSAILFLCEEVFSSHEMIISDLLSGSGQLLQLYNFSKGLRD